jgi:RHS repeat-associated protein
MIPSIKSIPAYHYFSHRNTNSFWTKSTLYHAALHTHSKRAIVAIVAVWLLMLFGNLAQADVTIYCHKEVHPDGSCGAELAVDGVGFRLVPTVSPNAAPGDYFYGLSPEGSSVGVRVFSDHTWAFFGSDGDGFSDQIQASCSGSTRVNVFCNGAPSGAVHSESGATSLISFGQLCDNFTGDRGFTEDLSVAIGASDADDNQTKECDANTGCSACQAQNGQMAVYWLHLMLASLHIEDTPISYNSPRGPSTNFKVAYNQREANQPSPFTYSNLGPKWTFNWLSYVTDNGPSTASANPTVYVRGGGTETYGGFNSSTGNYAADQQTLAVLVRVSGTTYEKRFPDGSKEIFSEDDGASSSPRRVFLSSVVDAVGNATTLTYDTNFRITAITDSLGQSMTLSYSLSGDPLKITKVTDPFGRFACFEYTSGQLTKITDPIGIQSQFCYVSGQDCINSMTTPYGTTTFAMGESGNLTRWIEATDPRTGKERVEYDYAVSNIASAETSTPAGVYNNGLQFYNSFYWDKKAMADAPGDYTQAHLYHWLSTADGNVSGIKHSEKKARENRVWYTYGGQTDLTKVGTNALPVEVARILDDGTTQLWQYQYNTLGNVTKEIDPQTDPHPRVKSYVYDTNNIDLLTVYQRNPDSGTSSDPDSQAADKIAGYMYDSVNEPPHKPKTVKDAVGQTTTYHYNSQGQVLTVTNAKSEVTTYAYDRDQNSDGETDGYLISITSPTFGSSHAVTTYTYDSANRVHTVTNSPDNYTVTTDYDNLNRPTQITYPDSTNQQFQYTDNVTNAMTLDLTGTSDRLGRWTYRHYNGNRQMDSMTDPLGQTTLYNWCTCGSLVGITDPNGNVTTFNRDLQSRVTSKVFADSSAIAYTYENTTSRLKSMTDALGQTTNYQYFTDNDVEQVSYTNALNPTPTVSYTYDLNYNRVASMADGTGTTCYHYNAVPSSPTLGANQLYQVDGPLSNDTITYTYDELGRALSQDINGTTASVVYDSLGRLYTTSNALGTFTRLYESDVTPRLKTLTNNSTGQTANYLYYGNSGDRRLQTLQHLTSGLVNLSQHDYTYDPEGQIQSWTKTLGTDETDLSFTYDDAKQLTNVSRAQDNLQSDYGYDDAGNRVMANFYTPAHGHAPNGTFYSYTANNLNQLDSTQETLNTDPQDPVAITYDADGNMTYDGNNQSFEWDAANRLSAVNYVDTGDRTEFTYDGLGRRVRIVEYGPGVTATIQPSGNSYATFTTGSITLPAGSYSLTFQGLNPNGGDNIALVDSVTLNSTLVPNGSFESPTVTDYQTNPSDTAWSYTGSAGIAANANPSAPAGSQVAFVKNTGLLSQIWSASAGIYTLSFKAAQRGSGNDSHQQLRVNLRPSGSVISAKTFVWCGNQICEERDSTGSTVTKRFFAEGEQRIGGSDAGNYYYSRDHLGSIREVTDSTGALKAQYDYDAWGNSVVVSGNMNVDFGFTGHYFHQPSGLNLAMYRAYNPTLGRWISRDPIAERGGLNLYEYVDNDPIQKIDPLGLVPAIITVPCNLWKRSGCTCIYECRCPPGYTDGYMSAFVTQPCSFQAPTRTCVSWESIRYGAAATGLVLGLTGFAILTGGTGALLIFAF